MRHKIGKDSIASMSKDNLVAAYKAIKTEADLMSLYLADREYWDKTPIRAQYSYFDDGSEIMDASWYRADAASDGYVVLRYYLIDEKSNRRGNPVGSPSIHSFQSLEESAQKYSPHAHIVSKLKIQRNRELSAAA